MIKIAVCDDEKIMQKFIYNEIVDEYMKLTDKIIVDVIDNHTDISNLTYNIIFLDIDMPDINGFEIAEKLNVCSPDTIIIFVSSHDELVYSSIKFKPFRFIRKEHLKEELPEAVLATIQCIMKKRINSEIEFNINDKIVYLNINEITYFEIYSHVILIHMNDKNVYNTIGTLSEFEDRFSDYDFIRSHKSYLVNCNFISSIASSEIIMKDGTCIPISRYKKNEVKSKFFDFIRRL